MTKKATKQDDNPAAPTTATINVPALGGEVTIRAVSWDSAVLMANGFPGTKLDKAMRVIAYGLVSPNLTLQDCYAVLAKYGEMPLVRVLNRIAILSGWVGRMPQNVQQVGKR